MSTTGGSRAARVVPVLVLALALALPACRKGSGRVETGLAEERARQIGFAPKTEEERKRRFLGLTLRRHAGAVAPGGVASVKTLKVRGEYVSGSGPPLDFTLVKREPDRVRMSVETPGGRFLRSYDGVRAWGLLPGQSMEEATLLGEEEGLGLIRDASIHSHLVSPVAKGNEVEWLSDPYAAGETYHIGVTLSGSGQQIAYELDRETYLPNRVRAPQWEGGKWTEVEAAFADFRLVDGILRVAFQTVESVGGEPRSTVEIHHCKVNVSVLTSYFEPPKESPAGRFRPGVE